MSAVTKVPDFRKWEASNGFETGSGEVLAVIGEVRCPHHRSKTINCDLLILCRNDFGAVRWFYSTYISGNYFETGHQLKCGFVNGDFGSYWLGKMQCRKGSDGMDIFEVRREMKQAVSSFLARRYGAIRFSDKVLYRFNAVQVWDPLYTASDFFEHEPMFWDVISRGDLDLASMLEFIAGLPLLPIKFKRWRKWKYDKYNRIKEHLKTKASGVTDTERKQLLAFFETREEMLGRPSSGVSAAVAVKKFIDRALRKGRISTEGARRFFALMDATAKLKQPTNSQS